MWKERNEDLYWEVKRSFPSIEWVEEWYDSTIWRLSEAKSSYQSELSAKLAYVST